MSPGGRVRWVVGLVLTLWFAGWVTGGVPRILSPVKDAVGPPEALLLSWLDAERINLKARGEAVFLRYLWMPVDDQDAFDVQLLHWNLLSQEGEFGTVRRVCPHLFVIDLRDFALDRKATVWEKFATTDVIFHSKVKLLKDRKILVYWPGGYDVKEGKYYPPGPYRENHKEGDLISVGAPWLDGEALSRLKELTLSEAPVVYGDWAMVQSARQLSIRNKLEGDGYYDFLGLKKRQDFFDLIGLDEKVAVNLFQEWREVVPRSGVSQQSRQVVAFGAVTGRGWGTLDVFTQQGRGQPKRNLRKNEFQHDTEEWYGFLPNGLPVTFLSDDKGNSQDSAPDKIGPDDSPLRVGKDARIHPNLGCLRCHGAWKKEEQWLKPVSGWARKHFRPGGPFKLQDPDRYTFLELRRQYLGRFHGFVTLDRANYADAVARLTSTPARPNGLTVYVISVKYAKAWNTYVEEDVSIDRAALRLGVPKELFLEKLRVWNKIKGGSDLVLSEYLEEPPGKLTVLEFEDSYAYAQALVRGLYPVDQITKVKELP